MARTLALSFAAAAVAVAASVLALAPSSANALITNVALNQGGVPDEYGRFTFSFNTSTPASQASSGQKDYGVIFGLLPASDAAGAGNNLGTITFGWADLPDENSTSSNDTDGQTHCQILLPREVYPAQGTQNFSLTASVFSVTQAPGSSFLQGTTKSYSLPVSLTGPPPTSTGPSKRDVYPSDDWAAAWAPRANLAAVRVGILERADREAAVLSQLDGKDGGDPSVDGTTKCLWAPSSDLVPGPHGPPGYRKRADGLWERIPSEVI